MSSTCSFFHLRQYLPEGLLLEEKSLSPVRICTEELAVVDLRGNAPSILACRGRLPIGANLFEALGILPQERSFYLQVGRRRKLCLLHSAAGALLMLNDTVSGSDTALAILPRQSFAVVYYALPLCGEEAASLSAPSLSEHDACPPVEIKNVCDQMRELFSLLNRIFLPTVPLPCVRRHLHEIARLAGCRAELEVTDPIPLALPEAELMRFSAFLLCTFLALWQQNDGVESQELIWDNENAAPIYRLRFLVSKPLMFGDSAKPLLSVRAADDAVCTEEPDPENATLAFLRLPAFRGYSLSRAGDALMLEALLSPWETAAGLCGTLPQRNFIAVEILRVA